jgi:hypothetical protein
VGEHGEEPSFVKVWIGGGVGLVEDRAGHHTGRLEDRGGGDLVLGRGPSGDDGVDGVVSGAATLDGVVSGVA